jgi:penicillin-binding protein 2
MEGCLTMQGGTAYQTLGPRGPFRVPGVRVVGKTGTAQVPGRKNVAWFICFAPVENPEIAVAVAVEGDTPGENFGGGQHAAPVAATVLRKYFEKKNAPAKPARPFFKTE